MDKRLIKLGGLVLGVGAAIGYAVYSTVKAEMGQRKQEVIDISDCQNQPNEPFQSNLD